MGTGRRESGSGSVYQRESDGRWFGSVDYGFKPNGTRDRRTVSAKTEKEVRRKLRDLLARKADDSKATGDRRTNVKTYSETWLKRTRMTVRPHTWINEAGAIRKWIVPTIGHRRLVDLEPNDIRLVANTIMDAGLSPSTAHRYQGVLMRMLKAASLDGYQITNRVFLTENPPMGENDREAMTTEQALAVLAEAGKIDHGTCWLIAFLQGMRRGEVLGMTWDNVDLDAGLLHIEWQLKALPYRIPYDRTSGFVIPRGYTAKRLVNSFHLVRPKTKKSIRTIPLVPVVVQALRDWQQVAPANPWGLVWATPSGRPFSPDLYVKEFKALQEAAQVWHPGGRRYLVHEIRNTTATLLLELKVPESVRIAIMGHSSIAVTRGYETVANDIKREALQQVAEQLQLTPKASA